MSRRTSAVIVFAAAALSLSACTTKTPPADRTPPASNDAPTSSSGTGVPFAGAPTVANPLPASVLSGDPCADALTPAQLEDFIGAPLKTDRADLPQLGPACSWGNLSQGSNINVGYDITTHNGLSGLYQNTKPQSGVWKPIADVSGFPAVAHAGNRGTTPTDYCITTVGLADDLSVNVAVNVSREKQGTLDPCDASTDVADAVVATLKSKAGS
jgi:hypothetical protein